ncbi:hypothetical protein Tco_0457541, partial [Tanacetum coccineum]
MGLHLILHHQQVHLELQEPLALMGRHNHHHLLHRHPTLRVINLQAQLPPSSSKTAASVEYRVWTTNDTRIKPSVSSIPKELHMDDDTIADEQASSSGAEDIGHDHIPTVNLRQSWWKPLTEGRP